MNANRRKGLNEVIEILESAKELLEQYRDEETEAFDNLPESLQGSERGELLECNIGSLDNAIDFLDDSLGEINTAIQ